MFFSFLQFLSLLPQDIILDRPHAPVYFSTRYKCFCTRGEIFKDLHHRYDQFSPSLRKPKPIWYSYTKETEHTHTHSHGTRNALRMLNLCRFESSSAMSAIMCCMSAHEERENSGSACWHEAVPFLFPNQNRSLESAATKISPSLVASKGAHLVMLGATLNNWRTFSRHIITILGTFSAKVNQRSIILHTRKLVRGAKRGRSFHPCKIWTSSIFTQRAQRRALITLCICKCVANESYNKGIVYCKKVVIQTKCFTNTA